MSLTATYLDKLIESNSTGGNYYGSSLAISASGNTLAAAASYTVGASNSANGAIRVLTRSGSTWVQTASFLTPSATSDDQFDYALSLSADGSVLAVGVMSADVSTNADAGKVYIYRLADGAWSLSQTISASDGVASDYFGSSVSLSGDSLTLIVGAPSADSSSGTVLDSGAAYVYSYSGSSFSLQQKITPSDQVVDNLFGGSVSISLDGSIAAIGSVGVQSGSEPFGAAYMFTRSDATWTQQQKITAVDATSGNYFGYSVALSADGNTLIVGSSSADDSNTANKSSISVFSKSGSLWMLQSQLLKSGTGTSEYFGHSLSVSFDGSSLLAGIWEGNTNSTSETGAAYLFRRSGSVWSQAQRVTTTDSGLSNYFGYSVALASYGSAMAIGAPYSTSVASSNAGAIYGYSLALTDTDSYSPLVVSPTVSVTSSTLTSISLSWQKAYDNLDTQSSLNYEVRYSTSNNISTPSDFVNNGTIGMAHTANVVSTTITGLAANTTYYVNVGVKDSSGNISVYSTASSSTQVDTIAPVVGASGAITATPDTQSIMLNWTKASDNYTSSSNEMYAVYRSLSNNISTVAQAEANGTLVMTYTYDVSYFNATNLSPGTWYYFNVIVKDEAGNKSPYAPINVSTVGDVTAPTPGSLGAINAAAVSQTRIDLSWVAASDAITSAANLQYAVYRSSSANLTSVANIEANGTLLQDYTANVTSYSATGLTYATTYYFNVIVKDAAGNKAAYSTANGVTMSDTVAPTAGVVYVGSVSYTSLSVSWTAGSDDYTSTANLQYAVYQSASNNLGTVSQIEANGTLIRNYSTSLTPVSVSNLSLGTTYYYNVIVKDLAGNKKAYTAVSALTLDDTASPVVGTLTSTSVSMTSVTLSWTAATDDYSDQSTLQYIVYKSSSNNISTVADAETNGTIVRSWSTAVSPVSATGLTSGTKYYFNVLVKDEKGNKSAYASINRTTTSDTISPIPGNMGVIDATAASQTRIDLSWTAAVDNYTSVANLQYAVYRSSFDNLDTVENTEANGTLVYGYASNTTSYNVLSLNYNTTYYFNVIVKDAAGNKSVYSSSNATTLSDNTAPTAGVASISNVGLSSMSVSWTAATDDLTPAQNLKYAVYQSSSNDISTVANAEMNGVLVQAYANGTGPVNLTGLTQNTAYYFTVVVKDLAGNKAAYATVNASTQSDTSAPTPGGLGVMSVVPYSQTRIDLSWTAATDNSTARSSLQYAVYRSSSSNISTVAQAEANGTLVQNYAANLTSLSVTGLVYSTTYYFNVVVKDDSGNKAAYSVGSAATLGDVNAPNVGYLSASNASMTGMTLSWTAASDDFTPANTIQYSVYQSTANNIGSVSQAETNGLQIRSYSTSTASFSVTGLLPSTTYYFTVIAKDGVGNKSVYPVTYAATLADTTPPTVGVATASSISYQNMTVSWTAASDSITSSNQLQYAVYQSTLSNIVGVANAEANGVCIRFYSTDTSPVTATTLTAGTTYYFTVVVRDAAGNKAAYSTINATTLADSIAPAPGGGGYISAATVSDSRIDISWTSATDSGSSSSELEYAVYRSRINNIGTVSTALANGTLVQGWTSSLSYQSITSLAVGTLYYINVLVRDAAGNMSAYVTQTASTRSDVVPPTVSLMGGVFVSSVSWSSLNLAWVPATDNLTAQSELLYRVYQSRSSSMSSVSQIETNGVMLTSTQNISSFNVTNLAQGTTYYFNVIVIDRFGNKSAYAPVITKTTLNNVSPVPGAAGSIGAQGSASGSVLLTWARAFDTFSQISLGSANNSMTLQYAVYSAPYAFDINGNKLFPSFRTVAEVETIGTKVMDYSTDTLSFAVDGLDTLTTYYFNIVVKDSAGNKATYLGVKAVTLVDSTPPVPGFNGTISTSYVTDNSVVLNWGKAVDDYTQQSRLRYEVRYSTSNNIDTVWTFKNGLIAVPYTSDIATATVTGLMPSRTYYFNVMVMDSAGNKAVYSMANAMTAADLSGPVAGNNGLVTFSQIVQDQLRLSWTKASDSVSAREDIQYAVYQSEFNNISTVAQAEANGDMVVDYSPDFSYAIITDLNPGTRYYFLVVAKDAAGNKTPYSVGNVVTAPDSVAPTAGDFGSVRSGSVTISSARLSWTKASDDYTAQSLIKYSLYYSMMNNIGTVADAETNGTPIFIDSADVSSHVATGLSAASTYYFNVVAKDASGNKTAYNQARVITVVDTYAPSIGNSGIVNASLVASDSVLLSWTMGVDNVTSSDSLQYGVYRSSSNDISTVLGMEANGVLVRPFTVGATTLSVRNLSASTGYYFNVMIMDSAGNRAAYNAVQVTTLADTTAPTAGGEGRISFSSINKDSMMVSWNNAIDNNSFTTSIQYEVRMAVDSGSGVPDLSTAAAAEANGEVVKIYSSVNYGLVTGLDSGTNYYFNVIAKDEAGNKTVYSQTAQATANDLVQISSQVAEINSPIIIASNIDLIKSLPAIAGDPTLSRPSNWAKIHMIYKSDTTSKRVVVTITDFTQMSGQFVAKDAETFNIHKIIVEDDYGNFVSVPAESITNASNWSLSVT
jgi:hypothetical protein